MKEQPNTTYIDEIAGGNVDFKEKLITIIKTEFPQEKKHFSAVFEAKKYSEAAEAVHKLKHKINIFGLSTGYQVASDFEKDLHKGKIIFYNDFMAILEIIEIYLKTI